MATESEKRERAIRSVTDDLLTAKFTQELGQKAIVERSAVESERNDELREVLQDIGRDMEKTGTVPKGMQYAGSLSVHVFKSEALKTVAFATLNATNAMSFDFVDGALRELTGSTFEQFGRARKKLRSGF
jgi:hypothetical protein